MDNHATDFWSATAAGTGGDCQIATTLDGRPTHTPATPRTYASIARHARPTPTSRRDVRLPLTETDRLQRTQVIRRTEYGFTERDIIQHFYFLQHTIHLLNVMNIFLIMCLKYLTNMPILMKRCSLLEISTPKKMNHA